MIEALSKNEKSDILLALALAFESRLNGGSRGKTAAELTGKYFAAFTAADGERLGTRANYFDRLPAEKANLWQKSRLDKIRRRGLPDRLDANVHPLQIAGFLNPEPEPIQLLVLKNLPPALSRKIAAALTTGLAEAEFASESTGLHAAINDEIVALIRHRFIANFVALEDVYEASETDRIPILKFEDFIRHLGIRETAIACRGINSKETLAAFLNRFDEESAKEIAKNITELENVKPFWVEHADRLLRKILEREIQPKKLLRSLGHKILAIAFVARDQTARRYAAQKMEPSEAENWLATVAESEREYHSLPESERWIMDRRRRIVERLAANFV